MRKVLSLVLVLALVLGSFAFTFAATPSDVVGEDSEDAVNVLMELGVVSGYPDGSYKPAGIVTRGEMAKIIICALGLEDYAAGKSSFSDMAGHWADKYVAYAVSLGIINGYPDNTFKADNTVSYDEAAKMLVASLGYTEESLVGSWPVNWVTKAKVLGILDDIKAGSAGANRGDIAIMAYQSLALAIGKTNKDGDWVASVPADDMLTRLGATLAAAGAAFTLTDAMADDAIADVRDLVGAQVKAYVNDDNEIIAIKSVESEFLTGEFDLAIAGPPTEFETDDETYDVIAFASLAAADYYTNGKADAGVFGVAGAAAATEYKIAADVSGVKINDIYSISQWTLTDDFYFDEDMLEDDNLNGYDFTLDDYNKIDLSSFELLGVDSLADIEEDDVIYVYTAGGTITKIEVGTETVEGEVTKVNSTNDTFTMGGKAYDASAVMVAAAPSAGDEVEFILDYAGDVYDVDTISDATNYAMVAAVNDGVAGVFGSVPEIQLVLADGTNKIFEADADAIDDGTNAIINPTTLAWTDGVANAPVNVGALIKYSVNADGEIDAITALTEVDATAGTADVTSTGYYNGAKIKSDAVVLVYDGGVAFAFGGAASYYAAAIDEDDFSATTVADILGTDNIASYYSVNSSGLIELMIVDSGAVVSDEIYGVVTEVGTNNSDAGRYAVMLIAGEEVTKDAAGNYAALIAAGTLVEVAYDTNGVATLQNAETAALAAAGTAAPTGPATSFKLSINSSNVVALDATITGAGTFDVDTAPFTLIEGVQIYKWNGTEYEVATMSDLKSNLTAAKFLDTGAAADRDGIVDIVLITKL